jgi:hypothetical protein
VKYELGLYIAEDDILPEGVFQVAQSVAEQCVACTWTGMRWQRSGEKVHELIFVVLLFI